MTYASDYRWRAVFLMHVYGISVQDVSYIFGPKVRTILRWYSLFLSKGVVEERKENKTTSRWPPHVIERVRQYVKEHPTFYLEEVQDMLKDEHPELRNVSLSTICRALNFDMNLTRNVLTKAARECAPQEVEIYKAKLEAIYSNPEQLLFLDETSKDGRQAYRRYAWSRRNQKAVVRLPFSRGQRRSILAAIDHKGFVAWASTPGTFTRNSFHRAFVSKVLPLLNPWPMPRSIVILDNAKIHHYKELEEAVHQAGARLLFLPPYAPHLNPIEPKRKKKEDTGVLNLYAHCGYTNGALSSEKFSVATHVSDEEE
ncbi:hypothetical protein PR001_g28187 [Phytophthora rubi]|uniref:Tc1-like transposase DDE domain-containing protein n=1 Tax=Phytophthora rubi TaxID=129364 RepID=A0A6A3HEC3_9STRA|nr:hypothetical protein PR001_g28187 [Phytophthora rubi]